MCVWDFPGGSEVKASACNVGDLGSIPGSGRSPGEGISNPLQCSCLENPMDGGAWWATVHGAAKSRTRLSDFISLHFTSLTSLSVFNMYALFQIWEIFNHYLKMFFQPCFFLLSFWNSSDTNVRPFVMFYFLYNTVLLTYNFISGYS